MKDKIGIEICCKNCDVGAQVDCFNWNPQNGEEGSEHCVNEYFLPSHEACEARIEELQRENERLLDCLTEHNILHSDVQRGMDRLNALADKREGLKSKCEVLKSQAFTIEEIDLIRNVFRVHVDENERIDGDDKSDSFTIIAKCDAILKGVEK